LYILQESLFFFNKLQKLESKERLPIFFSACNLQPFAKELSATHTEVLMDIADKGFFSPYLQHRLRTSVHLPDYIAVWTWIFASVTNAGFGLIGKILGSEVNPRLRRDDKQRTG